MKNNKVLIIEDEPKVASFIMKGLESSGFQVELAKDGLEGQKMALTSNYDAIVLDIKLPKMDGFEVCKQLRIHNLKTPVLMLTALGTIEDKIKGFDYGANDYLTKPFEFQELLVRIRSLINRFQTAKEESLRIADLELFPESKTVIRGASKVTLTAKEFVLFEYLLRNKGKVISKKEIAEKIWESNLDANTNVIDVYINFLRKKIDIGHPQKLIHTHVGLGYVIREEE